MAVPARKVRQLPAAPPARRPRAVRPARPPHRTPPRAVTRLRPRRGPFAFLALVVVTALVVALVSAQAMVAQEAFRVADLSRTVEELEEGHGRLKLRVAELTSPPRLVKAARRAGLVLPDPERVQILEVEDPDPSPADAVPGNDEAPAGPVLAEGAGG